MDLLDMITEAWETKVLPIVQKNPDELARRLARRRSGMMNRPPRAWCIALRAADQRINPATAACSPEDAAYPRSHIDPDVRGYYVPQRHEVTLTAALVRKLVAPVQVYAPGETEHQIAERLGCSAERVIRAARAGQLRASKFLSTYGREDIELFTRELLDPGCGRFLAQQDILWGTQWRYLSDRVPGDLEQTVERIPVFLRERVGSETLGGDAMGEVPRGRRAQFSGWRRICPICSKPKRMLFYPLPPVMGVFLLESEIPVSEAPSIASKISGSCAISTRRGTARCRKTLTRLSSNDRRTRRRGLRSCRLW